MRITLLFLTLSLSFSITAQVKPIDIRFNKNMEFYGYIIELGDPSDNDPNHPIAKEINKYPANRNNETLFEIFTLAADIDYATIVNLLYFLPEFPLDKNYELPSERVKALGYESDEELRMIRTIVQKTNKLYIESNFESIWANLAPYRTKVLSHLTKNKPSQVVMKEMEIFYDMSYAQYEIVPSLTIWSGPGWGIKDVAQNKAIFILGPLNKNYDFEDTERFLNLAIHEFGHSFVNHVVLQHKDQIKKTADLFPALKPDMVPQGYRKWESCVIEHFVRAGEVIIPESLGNSTGLQELIEDYTTNRKFIYLPFIIEKLKTYRLDKKFSYQKAVRKTLVDLEKEYAEE